ncbi:MAG TPA: 3-isopropylmalate dehydratase small subunit [Deinococcales bacterium]|nr:3-isopropylmalate dehydratase small subunit [Deinococcales bacterium]
MPKVHVYRRPSINTDEIIPARYLTVDDEATLARHAMEDLDQNFVKVVHTGDFLVAGQDFGCGSSREHAVWAIRGSGVKAVIAESYARIFYRNCVNNGFLAIECPGVAAAFETGDEANLDVDAGTITNARTGQVLHFPPIPEFAKEIARHGGLLESLKAREAAAASNPVGAAR